MHPIFIVAIPLVLVLVGIVLNSIGLSFNQPPTSAEVDPAKRATADVEAYRRFFDLQRSQAVTRQKRVGQYAWLLIAAIIGSFIWLYLYTAKQITETTQMATLQTLPTEDGKATVLDITLKDGSNVKYLIKLPEADKTAVAAKEAPGKISKWEIERLGTALSTGDNPLTLGVALKLSQLVGDPK